MSECLQFWLSAENAADARLILERLTVSRLIVGGSVVQAPSHFRWKGECIDLPEYSYVLGFTIAANRTQVETEYAKLSKEEVPMASFVAFDGNQKFLTYIQSNCIAS